ncbi:hypothetical protein MKX01_008952 [Papaver californicum]|nr:hypothetical protein MKX01_008952 [Papaver californicum]
MVQTYLAFPRYSKKVVGGDGDIWCSKCKIKVETPISRFLIHYEVEDNTGSAVFVSLDSQVQKLVRHTASQLMNGSEITQLSIYSLITLEYQHVYQPVYSLITLEYQHVYQPVYVNLISTIHNFAECCKRR